MVHDYEINDQVLIYRDVACHTLEGPFIGLYTVVHIYTNGTVNIQYGKVTERINIRRLTPVSADR